MAYPCTHIGNDSWLSICGATTSVVLLCSHEQRQQCLAHQQRANGIGLHGQKHVLAFQASNCSLCTWGQLPHGPPRLISVTVQTLDVRMTVIISAQSYAKQQTICKWRTAEVAAVYCMLQNLSDQLYPPGVITPGICSSPALLMTRSKCECCWATCSAAASMEASSVASRDSSCSLSGPCCACRCCSACDCSGRLQVATTLKHT